MRGRGGGLVLDSFSFIISRGSIAEDGETDVRV